MLDPNLAAFLQEGLGIHIGTRNQRLEPNGARALAVVVEDDGAHLVVFVAEVAAARMLLTLPTMAGWRSRSVGRSTIARVRSKGTSWPYGRQS
jgi:hypothetical protein